MKRVYKYKLRIEDLQTIKLPSFAQILTVQLQKTNLCLWALVDPDETGEDLRTIEIRGTGHNMPETERKYLGTFQMMAGDLVFHVFERL